MNSRGQLYIPNQTLATSPELLHETRISKQSRRKIQISETLTGTSGHLDTAPQDESIEDAARRHQRNMLSLLGSHVAVSSAYCSLTGWKHFKSFCTSNGIDIFLRHQHAHFPPSPYPFASTILGNFLTYLCVDKGVQGLSACAYLWAVRYAHTCNHLDVSAFDHSCLTLIRSACKRQFIANEARVITRRLPFTYDMLDTGLLYLWDITNILHLALVTAILTSITYLLRKSECLHGFLDDHYLRSQDVEFEITDPETHQTFWCPSHDAHLYSTLVLSKARLFIRSAKNDQYGNGYPYENTVKQLSATNRFCIATVLWAYAVKAIPLKDMPFFSCSVPGSSFILTYEFMKTELKRAAERSGYSAARFGTHSLRIFGASLLHAAGKDSAYIMHWGRWKSLCFLDYIHWSLQEMEHARDVIANPYDDIALATSSIRL